MSLLPVDKAVARILGGAEPVGEQEHVALAEADGRVLAEDLVATRSQPPFPASAMDGYAVRALDAVAGAELSVIGEAAAGHGYHGAVKPGECVRIFTGAPVPQGADAILIQENAEALTAGRIRVNEGVAPNRYIRPEGLDFRVGERVLTAGTLLDPGRLTLAAALNAARLPVLRRPRVAILATGDELVEPGGQPRADQIIASNTFGVAALVRRHGGEPIDLGIAPDSGEKIEASIEQAVARGADILVTLGGASVGDHDLVQASLAHRGMTLDFWRIAMRPGKPLMSGMLGSMRVLGLPGNPVSSLVCSHLFLVPLLRRLAGLTPLDNVVDGVLGKAVPENDRRQDYLRARLERDEAGRFVAEPFERQDSSMMRLFAEAEGLVIRQPHAPPAEAGSPCRIMLLRQYR